MVFTAYEGWQTRETRVARLRRKEEMKVTAKREKIGVQRHIRIADSEMNAQIERLMEQPGYESANKVINDALYYGLPILAEIVCGDAVTQEERAALKAPRKSGSKEEEFYALAVRLLRESVLNATINKSILSSLYNLMNDMLDPKSETTKQFESGLMSDTPAYLERYETEGIKKLRR